MNTIFTRGNYNLKKKIRQVANLFFIQEFIHLSTDTPYMNTRVVLQKILEHLLPMLLKYQMSQYFVFFLL